MKKIYHLFTLFVVSFYLFGCSGSNQLPSELPAIVTHTPQNTITPTVSLTTPKSTSTRFPTATVSLTPTLVQIPKSTFDASKAVIQTLVPPAQCPPDVTGISIPNPETLNESQNAFEESIINILNSGGIREVVAKLSEEQSYSTVTRADLTHDNVPELIVENRYNRPGYLSIFGCDGWQYKKLLTVNAVYEYTPSVLRISDMNLNGMPDMVLSETVCSYCLGVRIFEWDGYEFQNLLREWFIDSSRNEISSSDIGGIGGFADAKVSDIDNNGTYEVVIQGGTPSALGDMYLNGPFRSSTIIYMWDGHYYSKYSREYSPPEYRFQAVQDGDDATSQGNYEDALAFYQDVIFSDQLKGWSAEEKENLVAHGETLYTGDPKPTPLPPHNEDYLPLAAYARYRIMLLHILNGYQNDAQVVYDTLQEKFPEGNGGYPYAEMAENFWLEYLNTQNIRLACKKAIEYAVEHREILIPLSGPEHGFWTKQYLPVDICPFTD